MNVGGSIRISNGIRLKYARLQRISSRLQRLCNLSDNKYCSRIPRVFFRNVFARILARACASIAEDACVNFNSDIYDRFLSRGERETPKRFVLQFRAVKGHRVKIHQRWIDP